jgi:hypothetical protein
VPTHDNGDRRKIQPMLGQIIMAIVFILVLAALSQMGKEKE